MPIQHLQVCTDRGNYWNFGQLADAVDNEVMLLQDCNSNTIIYRLVLNFVQGEWYYFNLYKLKK